MLKKSYHQHRNLAGFYLEVLPSTTWWLVARRRRSAYCVFIVVHAQLQTHRVLISHRVLRWEVIRATVQLQAHVTTTALCCSQQRTLIHGHIWLHCTHDITEMNFLYRDEQSIHIREYRNNIRHSKQNLSNLVTCDLLYRTASNGGCKADVQCSYACSLCWYNVIS